MFFKVKNRFSAVKDFTILELLIVVAVITILASLLLPALQKVRGTVRQINCASNLKQCGLALYMYTGDNENYYPSTLSYAGAEYPPQYYLEAYLGGTSKYSIKTGMSASDAGAFLCPSDRYRIENYYKMAALSYGMNYYCGNHGSSIPWCKKITACRRPSANLYFTDGYRPTAIDVRLTGLQWPLTSTAGHGPSDVYMDLRHGNAANILYLDGHVKKNMYSDLADLSYTIIAGWNYE